MPRKTTKKSEVSVSEPVVIEDEVKTGKLTPAEYFEKIKSLKESAENLKLKAVLENAEKMAKKFTITRQKDAASLLNAYVDMYAKEIKIIEAGFKEYVLRKDVEHFMHDLTDKSVFCCEIEDYPRDIPDPIVNKLADNIDLFDHIYIVFTDYTQKVSKQIDKRTREKDPIMFGAIELAKTRYDSVQIGPRFYFIGDWVDDFCDLTLEDMLQKFEEVDKRGKEDVVLNATVPMDTDELATAVRVYTEQAVENPKGSIVTYHAPLEEN